MSEQNHQPAEQATEQQPTAASIEIEKKAKTNQHMGIVIAIASFLQGYDRDFMEEGYKETLEKANKYDATAALNQRYSVHKGQLIREQAKAMHLLNSYYDQLKKITALQQKVKDAADMADIIDMAV